MRSPVKEIYLGSFGKKCLKTDFFSIKHISLREKNREQGASAQTQNYSFYSFYQLSPTFHRFYKVPTCQLRQLDVVVVLFQIENKRIFHTVQYLSFFFFFLKTTTKNVYSHCNFIFLCLGLKLILSMEEHQRYINSSSYSIQLFYLLKHSFALFIAVLESVEPTTHGFCALFLAVIIMSRSVIVHG